jgi:hypothetical protein
MEQSAADFADRQKTLPRINAKDANHILIRVHSRNSRLLLLKTSALPKSVLPQNANHSSLQIYRFRWDDDRFHGGVRGLQTDVRAFAIQPL